MTTHTATGSTVTAADGQYGQRLGRRADAAADAGHVEKAEQLGLAALRALHAARDWTAAADRACWLGELYEHSERPDHALDGYRTARQLYRTAEQPGEEVVALRRMGAVLLAADRSRDAIDALRTAHGLLADCSALSTPDAALVELLLGYARWARGRPRLAIESFRAAAAVFAHTADPRATLLQTALDQPSFQPPPARLLGFPGIPVAPPAGSADTPA